MDAGVLLSHLGSVDSTFAIKSFAALFIIVDAVGVVPIYLALLQNYKPEDKKAMILMAVQVAMVALLIMTFTGNLIFGILGVSMYAFKIAGGIMLLLIAVDSMLFGRKTRSGHSDDVEVDKEDIAITPLAIPLLTGPGAITTGIILFEEAGASGNSVGNRIVLFLNILLVFLVSYQILKRLDLVYRVFGSTGTKVVTKVMGLMLAAISVQFIISGLAEAIKVGVLPL